MPLTSALRRPGRRPSSRRSRVAGTLLDAVEDLRRDVAETRLPLRLPGVAAAEEHRRRLLGQLEDHLLPRLREEATPAVVVVAGSTGAGKSTLLNSLLGDEVSRAGVLRPTTRRPVLVHHPADGELLAEHPLRVEVDVVEHDAVPRGLALLDAPDLDSLLESNRAMAHRLLEAADLWLFVTTAARYGDAVPWEVLGEAAARGTALAVVLNRVPADVMATVRADLLDRMRGRGLSAVPLFLVPDAGPHEGLLPPALHKHVVPVQRWLTTVAGADGGRAVVERTHRGALKALRPWADELTSHVQAQVETRQEVERLVREAVEESAERVERQVRGGAAADTGLRSRWETEARRGGPLAGRATARRGRAARVASLARLAADVDRSVALVLGRARRAGDVAVRTALENAPAGVGEGLLEDLAGRGSGTEAAGASAASAAPEPGPAAAAWLTHCGSLVSGTPLASAVDAEGAGALLAAAAAGLGAARVRLVEALGEEGDRLVAQAEDALARAARDQVDAAANPLLDLLADDHLVDDAAARLRVRMAVLKGLT